MQFMSHLVNYEGNVAINCGLVSTAAVPYWPLLMETEKYENCNGISKR